MPATARPVRVLAISGSLRAASSNTALLHAAAAVAPPSVTVTMYEGLRSLPAFDPDEEAAPPPPAAALRRAVAAADALVISTPEYAHGVPGALKNALDWLVGGPEFVDRPVALFNVSARGAYAQASLRETLTVMSGRLVEGACLTLPAASRPRDAGALAADATVAAMLREALEALARAARA